MALFLCEEMRNRMPKSLKNLIITNTDLCKNGANPDAKIQLFKRHDADSPAADDADADNPAADDVNGDSLVKKVIEALAKKLISPASVYVQKEAKTFRTEYNRELMRQASGQIWDCCYALSDSLSSIIFDADITADAKLGMMYTSLDEFAEVARNAIPSWAAGKAAKAECQESVSKSAAQLAAFDEMIERYITPTPSGGVKQGGNGNDNEKPIQKGEIDTMKIDVTKMSDDEKAVLSEFEKKYGIPDEPASADDTKTSPDSPTIHPDVKKALDDAAAVRKAQTEEIEALKKSVEMTTLAAVAKKYEIIGKKADELAQKLYDLKKAGGSAYDDYIAALDEHVVTVEKSGMFSEIGKNTGGSPGGGGEIFAKAAEIKKANTGMTTPEAIAKAFEDNPDIAAAYEKEYSKGRDD
jgi:hypothetical protein